MSIREIKNFPVNSGTGMSIREAFDVVNANFNYLAIEAIPEQVSDAIADLSANLSTTFTGGNIASDTRVLSNTNSISSNTGALIVDGGAGIAGNVYVGGSVTADGVSITGNVLASGITVLGNISTYNINATNGSMSVLSITTDTITVSNSSTLYNTKNNGTFEVVGDVTIRSNVSITGNGGINVSSRLRGNNVIATNTLYATSTIDSIDTITGALQVSGGAGIVGNINVGGNLIVAGVATVGNSYVPVGSTSTGTAGQISWDQNWFYICVGTDQWIRFAKDTGVW